MNLNHRSDDTFDNIRNAYGSRNEDVGIQARFAMVSFFSDRFPTVNVYTLDTLEIATAFVLWKDPSPKEMVCSRSRFSNAISRTFLHDSDPTVRCSSDPMSAGDNCFVPTVNLKAMQTVHAAASDRQRCQIRKLPQVQCRQFGEGSRSDR